MTAPSDDEDVLRAEALAESIKPMLAGHGVEDQGAALMQLLALFIAGHPAQMREAVLAMHLNAVRGMIPVVERELFGPAGHPGGSPMKTKAKHADESVLAHLARHIRAQVMSSSAAKLNKTEAHICAIALDALDAASRGVPGAAEHAHERIRELFKP